MEKEAAGVYMSGHPLDEYRSVLEKLSFTASDLEEDDEAGEGARDLDGQAAEIGGILTEVKGKATRKGDYMAFVTLEDLTGQVECLVFPKVYERYQSLLQEDEAVVISGRISVREEEAPPRFRDCARHPRVEESGFVLYYSDQCPYTYYWVPRLEAAARKHGVPLRVIPIDSVEAARQAPSPVTNFSLFRDGRFLTHEILSEKKFLALAGIDAAAEESQR